MSEKKVRWRDSCGERNTEAFSVVTGRGEPERTPSNKGRERRLKGWSVDQVSPSAGQPSLKQLARLAAPRSGEVENEDSIVGEYVAAASFGSYLEKLKIELKKGIAVATEG